MNNIINGIKIGLLAVILILLIGIGGDVRSLIEYNEQVDAHLLTIPPEYDESDGLYTLPRQGSSEDTRV